MTQQNTPKIAVIGFGEAGSCLCQGWGRSDVHAFDIKQIGDTDTAANKTSQMQEAGVIIGDDAASTVRKADMIFSTVTADQAHAAASAAAAGIRPGAYFFDLNSCAPSTAKKCRNHHRGWRALCRCGGYGHDHPKISPDRNVGCR